MRTSICNSSIHRSTLLCVQAVKSCNVKNKTLHLLPAQLRNKNATRPVRLQWLARELWNVSCSSCGWRAAEGTFPWPQEECCGSLVLPRKAFCLWRIQRYVVWARFWVELCARARERTASGYLERGRWCSPLASWPRGGWRGTPAARQTATGQGIAPAGVGEAGCAALKKGTALTRAVQWCPKAAPASFSFPSSLTLRVLRYP